MSLLLFVVLALAGCGRGETGQGSGAQAQTSPTANPQANLDAAHRAWIDALRNNDRAAAQALLPPEFQVYVDRPLEQVRFRQDPKTGLGPLRGVDIQPVTAEGAGRVGVSVWHFQKKDECHLTHLSLNAQGAWIMSNWEVQPCPGA
jgi:hypothetical protein